MGEYRIDRRGKRPQVQHLDDRGSSWCGPIIGKAGHSREDEIPGPVLCISCGDFCRDIPDAMVKAALRFDAAWEREQEQAEARAKDLDKLRRAGVDVAALPEPKTAPRARRRVQLPLFGGSGGR